MVKPQRYRVQQDKGEYALKGCDDGDLIDAAEYDALAARLAEAERLLQAWLDGSELFCTTEAFLRAAEAAADSGEYTLRRAIEEAADNRAQRPEWKRAADSADIPGSCHGAAHLRHPMSPIRTADSAPADLRVEVNPYVPPGSVTFRAAESAWYDEILEGLDALSAADKVKTSTQAPACDRCGKPMEADGPGRWRRLHLGEV